MKTITWRTGEPQKFGRYLVTTVVPASGFPDLGFRKARILVWRTGAWWDDETSTKWLNKVLAWTEVPVASDADILCSHLERYVERSNRGHSSSVIRDLMVPAPKEDA